MKAVIVATTTTTIDEQISAALEKERERVLLRQYRHDGLVVRTVDWIGVLVGDS